jgi:hypothetical protein
MNPEEVLRQIAEMRLMTEATGRIHEAQAVQLRAWPIMVVPDALRSDVTIEMDEDGKRTVFVIFTMKDTMPTTAQWQMLAENFFWLLGTGWGFIGEVNGTKVFEDMP